MQAKDKNTIIMSSHVLLSVVSVISTKISRSWVLDLQKEVVSTFKKQLFSL